MGGEASGALTQDSQPTRNRRASLGPISHPLHPGYSRGASTSMLSSD